MEIELFEAGKKYSRKDVYRIIEVPPEKQGGNWDTGYNRYNNDIFIFSNVNAAGRTGHDYPNRFVGNEFMWSAKNGSKLHQASIQRMLSPEVVKYVFAREDSNNPSFTFIGKGKVKEVYDESPVRILWKFDDINENHPEILSEEVPDDEPIIEGAKKQITVNSYERNPIARQKCLEHFGYNCSVCDFNFYEKFGEIGKDFIHVHHLREISLIGEDYTINPYEDLRPVCPNCHAMLHKKRPAYSIEELKNILKN